MFPDGLGISDELAFAKRFGDFGAIEQVIRSHTSGDVPPIPLAKVTRIAVETLPPKPEPIVLTELPQAYVVTPDGDLLYVRAFPDRDQPSSAQLSSGDIVLGLALQDYGIIAGYSTKSRGSVVGQPRSDSMEQNAT
jgi:hypothetical protein